MEATSPSYVRQEHMNETPSWMVTRKELPLLVLSLGVNMILDSM